MADTVYDLGMTALIAGDIDWDANDIRVVLVDTADYTVDAVSDQFLSDIPGAAIVSTSAVLTGKAVTAGVATADDALFSYVTGDECEALVVYQSTGVSATSRLITYIDSAAGLPVTPTGGNINVAWTGGVVFYLSDLRSRSPLAVANTAARLVLESSDGDLVWQTDTNQLYVYADAATPSWELVYPAGDTQLSIDNPDLWGTNLGYDEEFNNFSSSLPSGWGWVNQSSSTFEQRFGKGIIAAPAVSGIQWRGIVRPVPTPSSYELVVKRSWSSRAGSEIATGIGFQDAGTNLLTFYWHSLDGSNEISLTSWANAAGGSPSIKAGPIVPSPIGMPSYLRVRKNSSTSYDFAYSHDGVMWYTLISAYNVASVLTPVNVGFMSYNSANLAWEQGLEWFRVRNIGWTPTP